MLSEQTRKSAQTETQEIPLEHKTTQEEEEEKNPTTFYSEGGQALGHVEPPSFGDNQNPSGHGPEQPAVADPALSKGLDSDLWVRLFCDSHVDKNSGVNAITRTVFFRGKKKERVLIKKKVN